MAALTITKVKCATSTTNAQAIQLRSLLKNLEMVPHVFELVTLYNVTSWQYTIKDSMLQEND